MNRARRRASPNLDTAHWPPVTTRVGGVSLQLAPDLATRTDASRFPQRYEGSVILVDSWYAPGLSLGLWLGPEGEFPVTVYDGSDEPSLHDWTECAEQVGGREIRARRLLRHQW